MIIMNDNYRQNTDIEILFVRQFTFIAKNIEGKDAQKTNDMVPTKDIAGNLYYQRSIGTEQ